MYTTLVNGVKIKRDEIETCRIIALIVPHMKNETTNLLENSSRYECSDFVCRSTYDIYVFKVSPAITEADLRRNLIFRISTQSESKQGLLYHIKLKMQLDTKYKLRAVKIYKDTFNVSLRVAKDIIDTLFFTGIVEENVTVYDEHDIYKFCEEMEKLKISTQYSIIKNNNQDGESKSM